MHERDVIERIFKRITQNEQGCWIVDGWHDGKGYRNVSIKGKTCIASCSNGSGGESCEKMFKSIINA